MAYRPQTKRFLAITGSSIPLIQAPMANSNDSALVIAVAQTGALGSLPAATSSLEKLEQEMALLHAYGIASYNLNFFCHTAPANNPEALQRWRNCLQPYYAQFNLGQPEVSSAPARESFNLSMAQLVNRYRPKVVSFHFGLPVPELLSQVKQAGAIVISSATTVAEAIWLESHGADLIVAQGLEAGGHRGHFLSGDLSLQLGLFALLPQIVQAVKIPVIAAGGIASAAEVEAAMQLGAAAVQVGTAFLRASEATTSLVHRQALMQYVDGHGSTALTNVFTGRPARGIVNRLMHEQGPLSANLPDFPLASNAVTPIRLAAESAGSGDFSALWAGQNPSGCLALSAAQIVQRLIPN
jgi:nitronate monooxygenase